MWKSKLAAYLHDPPSKCLDIATHGERSDQAFRNSRRHESGSHLRAAAINRETKP